MQNHQVHRNLIVTVNGRRAVVLDVGLNPREWLVAFDDGYLAGRPLPAHCLEMEAA